MPMLYIVSKLTSLNLIILLVVLAIFYQGRSTTVPFKGPGGCDTVVGVLPRYCGLQAGSGFSVPRVWWVLGYGVGADSEAVMGDNEDEGYVIVSLLDEIEECSVNVTEIDPFESVESSKQVVLKLI